MSELSKKRVRTSLKAIAQFKRGPGAGEGAVCLAKALHTVCFEDYSEAKKRTVWYCKFQSSNCNAMAGDIIFFSLAGPIEILYIIL